MASDTAPAAVPAPHDPPPPPAYAPATGAGQTPARGLAGLLAAVDPARPDFDLHPHTDAAAALHDTAGGASSADFDHDPATHNGQDGAAKSGSQQGVVRTWLLALAKRHEQAGAARLKALDVKKARATALQVKEQRNTTRSEKIVGGNTSSGTNTQAKADKNTGSSNRTSASRSDGKNHHTKNHNGTSGRGGSGHGSGAGSGGGAGRGGSGGGSGSGGRGKGDAGHGNSGSRNTAGGRGTGKRDGGKTPTPGTGSGSGGSKNASGGKDGASGKGGGTGPAGKSGNDGKTTANTSTGNSSGGGSGSGKSTKTPTSTCGDSSGIDLTKPKTRKDDKPKTSKTPANTTGTAGKDVQGAAGGPSGRPGDPGTGPAGKTGPKPPAKPNTTDKPNLNKTPTTPGNATSKDPHKNPNKPAPHGKEQSTTPAAAPKSAGGPVIDTQSARETGYRDGARIGRVEAQIGAYRDGLRDGRTDVKEAASREKTRLDKARDARKQPTRQAPVIPPKPNHPPTPAQPPTSPQPGPAAGNDKDDTVEATRPQPVQVDNIDANGIQFGGSTVRDTMSRGEIRTFRGYQNRLDERNARLTGIAAGTRALHQYAVEQARRVAQMREQARAVQGGDKLASQLAALEEATTIIAVRAEQVHKRATLARDASHTLHGNVTTRYQPVYQAVVDSPETAPAEMTYYMEMGNA